MHKLFPPTDKQNLLLVDNVGKYSITPPIQADLITYMIKKKCPEIRWIVDATAGSGGNTISFAKTFSVVTAIEIHELRFVHLRNNVGIYNLENVSCVNMCCIDWCNKLSGTPDIIFVDPPWGGRSYKYQDRLRLVLGKISIEASINIFLTKVSIVCLKLPQNYDIKYFESHIDGIIEYESIEKMLIVFVRLKENI
jgi:16S rRNA G966 N2-methylase RsmD